MNVREFVNSLWDNCRDGAQPITIEDAAKDIKLFEENGWELPENFAAEDYAEIWNELTETNERGRD